VRVKKNSVAEEEEEEKERFEIRSRREMSWAVAEKNWKIVVQPHRKASDVVTVGC
jgi:hypothetical protein